MSSNPEGSKASSKTAAGNSTSPGFLEKIDRYGYIPQLMYGGDTACKSQFGGFLTFGAGLCYVFLVCFTVYRYFERKSPSTSLNRVFRQDPEGFSITETSMPFAFGIQNPNYEHFIDETVYKVDAFYTESIKTVGKDGTLSTEYKKTKLNLIPCSQVGLDPTYFSNLELKSMFCLENYASKKLDLKISGRFESNYFSRIDIAFKRCKGAGCKSNTEIDKLLRDSYFAINYKDRVAELTQFESPVNQFPTSIFTSCSTDYLKYLHMYMADNTIITDSSLVGYMELDRIRFPSTGTYKTDFSSLVRSGEDYPDVFLNLVLRMDPIENIYNRKYNNIYNYLAEFGGLTQVIILSVFLLTFRFHYVYLNFDLAKKYLESNKLYHYALSVFLGKPNPFAKGTNKNPSNGQELNLNPDSSQKKKKFEWDTRIVSIIPTKNIKKRFTLAKSPVVVTSDKKILTDVAQESLSKSQIGPANKLSLGLKSQKKLVTFSPPKDDGWEIESQVVAAERNTDQIKPPHRGAPIHDRDASSTPSKFKRSLVNASQPKSEKEIGIMKSSSEKRYLEEFEEYNRLASNSKKVGFWDFLVACLFPCGSSKSNLESLLEKSSSSTYGNFDILRLAQAVDEVEKLKYFLFTPDQLALYELLPRQHLAYLQSQRANNSRVAEVTVANDDISGMYERLQQAFQSIESSESPSELDSKLLEAFQGLMGGYQIQKSDSESRE